MSKVVRNYLAVSLAVVGLSVLIWMVTAQPSSSSTSPAAVSCTKVMTTADEIAARAPDNALDPVSEQDRFAARISFAQLSHLVVDHPGCFDPGTVVGAKAFLDENAKH